MNATIGYASPPREDPTPGWGQSLSTGAAGISLLHIARAHAGTGGWDIAHQWVTAATRSPVVAHPDQCGLFAGAEAVAFTLHTANHPGYQAALDTLDSHITAVTRVRLERAHARLDRGELPKLGEFDLISGLTGTGAYLLHRHGGGDLLREVLAYLVRLTDPLHVEGVRLPGWWTARGPDGRLSPSRRGGHGNLGMAHGIAGPLALLSIAMRRGITVTGQADAISWICAWLDRWRIGTGAWAWWPGTISLLELQNGAVQQRGPQRPSWCYGTPGLARAQQLAALALADPARQQRAEETLAGCVTDGHQLAQLSDSSLCHGWAGLLRTTWRAAADAGPDSELLACLPSLAMGMEHHIARYGPPSGDGLLEGTAGVRLVQHTTMPAATAWDACLLLG